MLQLRRLADSALPWMCRVGARLLYSPCPSCVCVCAPHYAYTIRGEVDGAGRTSVTSPRLLARCRPSGAVGLAVRATLPPFTMLDRALKQLWFTGSRR